MINRHFIYISFLIAVCTCVACGTSVQEEQGYLHKDLSEQMDALAILQGAIGEELNRGTPQNADWLVEGLDSVLLIVRERLNNHSSLNKPFEKYYDRKLKAPIERLRDAIKANDTTAARSNYIVLVDRCNSCHKEHAVEEKAHY